MSPGRGKRQVKCGVRVKRLNREEAERGGGGGSDGRSKERGRGQRPSTTRMVGKGVSGHCLI